MDYHGEGARLKQKRTLVEELNDMDNESPVKRLMEEFPALKYSSVDQAKLLNLDAEEEQEEEVNDMVNTLRKSVTEALGQAMSKHRAIKAIEKQKSEKVTRVKKELPASYMDGSSGGSMAPSYFENKSTSRNATNQSNLTEKA